MNEKFIKKGKGIEMKEKKFKKNAKGVCPMCGSYNLNWGDSDINDNYLGYEYECEDCGAQGQEWYRLVFDGHEIYNKETQEYEAVNDYILPEE